MPAELNIPAAAGFSALPRSHFDGQPCADCCLADPRKAGSWTRLMIFAWATELRLFRFRSSQAGQAADLSNHFSKAFSLHNQHPGDAVLQFAIACLRSVNIDPANWPMFQKLLLLCVIPEPACLPYVLEQIIVRRNAGAGPILGQMEEIANDLIQNHSSLKHSSEVANAVWACLALRLQISDKAVDAVSPQLENENEASVTRSWRRTS